MNQGTNADGSETLLRAEVAFWQEMIDACGEEVPVESRERMKFALQLAERRLQHVFWQQNRRQQQAAKIYHLEEQRARRA